MAGRAGGEGRLAGPAGQTVRRMVLGAGRRPAPSPGRRGGALRATAFPTRGLGEGQGPPPPLCSRKFSEGEGLSHPCGGYTVP